MESNSKWSSAHGFTQHSSSECWPGCSTHPCSIPSRGWIDVPFFGQSALFLPSSADGNPGCVYPVAEGAMLLGTSKHRRTCEQLS